MDPSWQPDPTGRHHYRWWDGAAWTDSVADRGVVSTDAFRSGSPVKVTVITTPGEGEPPAPSGAQYATVPVAPVVHVGRWIALGLLILVASGVAVYLFAFRDEGGIGPSGLGVSVEQLDGPQSFAYRDVRMDDGDAIRYRVEGDPDRDLVTYLVAEDQLATDQAMQFFTDYRTNVGITDPDELLTDLTEADDVMTEGDVQDALRRYTIIKKSDRCCTGAADADSFVATVPGTYRIVVVEALGRPSSVRIIVERYREQLFAYAAITDALDNAKFFTDTGFFEDSEPYDTDSGP